MVRLPQGLALREWEILNVSKNAKGKKMASKEEARERSVTLASRRKMEN